VSGRPCVVHVLDTPNVVRGTARAGTPARVLGLVEHGARAGARSVLALCDRGADYGTAADWAFPVLLVHPDDFYDPGALARTIGAAVSTRVDLVVGCESESLAVLGAPVARALGARLVFDVHDDEAVLAQSLGEPAREVTRLAAVQAAAVAASDKVIVSTRHERDLVRALGAAEADLVLLPNGVDAARRPCWGPDVTARTLAFLGNMFYEPNARAARFAVEELVPGLRDLGAAARLRLVGQGPGPRGPVGGDVEFTGRVEDLDAALSGASLALAPLDAGSGAKMKVLDYLAAGLPVLGTSQAVTGLSREHPGVLVEDDLTRWPRMVADLLADPARLRDLGSLGRESVESGPLSWPRIGADLVSAARLWSSGPLAAPDHRGTCAGGLAEPRWQREHRRHDALGTPSSTAPGRPVWLAPEAPCGAAGERR
jgi:glycosyltransferase involved in cell wall biosynthesis